MRDGARTASVDASIQAGHRRRVAVCWRRALAQTAACNENIDYFNPGWNLAMKRMNVRDTLSAAALIGGSIVTASALAQPSQGGTYGPGNGMGTGMMDGSGTGWIGGYGGMWVTVLLVIVVAGFVAWVVAQKKK